VMVCPKRKRSTKHSDTFIGPWSTAALQHPTIWSCSQPIQPRSYLLPESKSS
jgi:hypothetical protein